MKKAIEELNKYTVKIEDRDTFQELDYPKVLEAYQSLLNEKHKYQSNWEKFLEWAKLQSSIIRIRDLTQATEPHCYRAAVSFNQNNGCVICISLIGKFMGIHYVDYKIEPNIPLSFYGLKLFTFPLETQERKMSEASYFPYTRSQLEESRNIMDFALHVFPNFKKFDNTYASIEFENIFIGGETRLKTDLFQSIFTRHVGGVV